MRADQTSACPECLVRFARSSRCPKCGQPSFELRSRRSRAAFLRRCEDRQRQKRVAALRHDFLDVTFAIADDTGLDPNRFGRRVLAILLIPTLVVLALVSMIGMDLPDGSALWAGMALSMVALWSVPSFARRWRRYLLARRLRAVGGQDLSHGFPAVAVVPAAQFIAPNSPARASFEGTVRRRTSLCSPLAGVECVAFRVVGHSPHGEIDDACAEVFDVVTDGGESVEVAAGDAIIALSAPSSTSAVPAPSRAFETLLLDRGHVPAHGALHAAEAVLRDGDRVTVEGVLDTEPRPTNYREQHLVRVLHAARGSPLILRDRAGSQHLRVAVTPAEADPVDVA